MTPLSELFLRNPRLRKMSKIRTMCIKIVPYNAYSHFLLKPDVSFPDSVYVSKGRNHRPYRGLGFQSLACNLEYGVRARPSASNIFGGQSSTRAYFYLSSSVFLFSIIPQALIFHSSAFSAIRCWLLTVSLNGQSLYVERSSILSWTASILHFAEYGPRPLFSGASHYVFSLLSYWLLE